MAPARTKFENRYLRVGTSICALSAALLMQNAAAQTSSAAAVADEEIDTIIVTANKREQSLQDAALAVSVVSTETLEGPNIVNLTDISNRIPGLTVTQSSAVQNTVSIRGLTPTSVRVNSFPLVSTYIDDVPISESATPNIASYDLSRVEVLRGPQGTLYGESSSGGTIRYVTNAPEIGEFSAKGDARLGFIEDGNEIYEVRSAVNVPLSDIAALRLVGTYIDHGGFVNNEFLDRDGIDAYDMFGFRGSLLVEPTSDLSVRLTGMYQEFDGGDNPRVYPNDVSQALIPTIPTTGDTEGYQQFQGIQQQELSVINLTIDYDIGPGTLTSATSYYDKKDTVRSDEVETTFNLNGFLGGAVFLQDGTDVGLDAGIEVFSQELRYTARLADRLDLTLGGYYRKREQDSFIAAQSEEFGAIVSGFFGVNFDGLVQRATEASTYEQFSTFAQGTYSLTDTFRVTAGLRYYNEDVSGEAVLEQVNPATFQLAVVAPNIADDTEAGFLFRAGLEYDISPDILVYTNFSQGYRPGGVNARFNPFVGPEFSPRTFDADFVNSYDLGLKTEFFNGRTTLNIEAFYIDYEDPQFTDTRDPQFTPTTNAGAGESYGVEAEFFARLTDDWTLGGSFAYVDAQFTENGLPIPGGGFVINDEQDFIGFRDFSANLYSQYRISLPEWGGDVVLNGDVSYAGEALGNFNAMNNPNFNVLGDYVLANASIEYDAGTYVIGVFANNLTNEFIELGGNNLSGIVRNDPRTVGVRVGFDF
ncbi:MAG: TonB-dependent receptor [Pseudomonadota bacterium]